VCKILKNYGHYSGSEFWEDELQHKTSIKPVGGKTEADFEILVC